MRNTRFKQGLYIKINVIETSYHRPYCMEKEHNLKVHNKELADPLNKKKWIKLIIELENKLIFSTLSWTIEFYKT